MVVGTSHCQREAGNREQSATALLHLQIVADVCSLQLRFLLRQRAVILVGLQSGPDAAQLGTQACVSSAKHPHYICLNVNELCLVWVFKHRQRSSCCCHASIAHGSASSADACNINTKAGRLGTVVISRKWDHKTTVPAMFTGWEPTSME